MTNLTEQWNKDKLKDGFYYVAIDEPFMPKKVEIIEFYKTGFETDMDSNYMHEVLSEVPSYEEYQKLLSDQLAKNEGVEINAELEERLKKTQELEQDFFAYQKMLNKADKDLNKYYLENTKLKELLKRIRKELNDCPTCVEGSWKAELVDEIDQVLGVE